MAPFFTSLMHTLCNYLYTLNICNTCLLLPHPIINKIFILYILPFMPCLQPWC